MVKKDIIMMSNKELNKLHIICTINKRFSIAPAKDKNLYRKIPKEIDLESIFLIKVKRKVSY